MLVLCAFVLLFWTSIFLPSALCVLSGFALLACFLFCLSVAWLVLAGFVLLVLSASACCLRLCRRIGCHGRAVHAGVHSCTLYEGLIWSRSCMSLCLRFVE